MIDSKGGESSHSDGILYSKSGGTANLQMLRLERSQSGLRVEVGLNVNAPTGLTLCLYFLYREEQMECCFLS